MKKKLILLFLLLFCHIAMTQIPCATDEYNKPLIDANPEIYKQIERDIQNYIKIPKQKSGHQVTIPVVFHIVYNDDTETYCG